MSELRYTLVSDGPSDAMFIPLLDWILQQHSGRPFIGRWAELRNLRRPPKGLAERVQVAIDLFPCDLLFVHRDAESMAREKRVQEIARELASTHAPDWVAVVPVRMQEAWFLFEERALRVAAGNPDGAMDLALPVPKRVESLPHPKELLERLLRDASGYSGRRLDKLRLGPMKRRVAELIQDYTPLRTVPAFAALEADVQRTLAERRWS